MSEPGLDLDFVGTDAYTIRGVLFKKKSTQLGKKVNIYLEWKKKSKQIHLTIQKNSIRFVTNCCSYLQNSPPNGWKYFL